MKPRLLILFLLFAFTSALAGTWTNLDFPGSTLNTANGVNSNGQVVGTYDITTTQCFLWTAGNFTSITYPGSIQTICNSINDVGDIVGYYSEAGKSNWRGFLLQGGTFTTLSFPNAKSTLTYGINNTGEIVGSYTDQRGVTHGFTYVAGTYTDVTLAGALSTQLYGVNNNGDTVGDYQTLDGRYHGLILTGGLQFTVDLAAIDTFALAINDNQQVVGWEDAPIDAGFFLHSPGRTPIVVNKAGTQQVWLSGINNSNFAVGWYRDLHGAEHGFLKTP